LLGFGRVIGKLLFGAVVLLATIEQPLAHSPYFTRSEKVVLPDGTTGEMRLLHGDGIIAADPARVIVIGADGRLLARSDRSPAITLICEPSRRTCKGYNRNTLEVLKPDPSSFQREGPIVDGIGDGGDNDPRWGIEGGKESWGFSRRPAPLPMIVAALVTEASKELALFGFVTLAIVSGIATVVIQLKPIKSLRWRAVVRGAQLIACLLLGGLTLLYSLVAYAIGDMSISLILVGLLAGVVLSIAGLSLGRCAIRFWQGVVAA
jgi:hypothetical protein